VTLSLAIVDNACSGVESRHDDVLAAGDSRGVDTAPGARWKSGPECRCTRAVVETRCAIVAIALAHRLPWLSIILGAAGRPAGYRNRQAISSSRAVHPAPVRPIEARPRS